MNSGPQLALGARGRDVQRVQTILVMMKTLGFDQIDSVFGTLTRNAVVAFQESEGLPADGVVGDSTWQRMPADPDTPIVKRGSTGTRSPACRRACSSSVGLGRRPMRDRPTVISDRAPKLRSRPTKCSTRWRMTAWSARARGGCLRALPARLSRRSPG
jgi:hypothetical protein